jgi:hypothetical protein
MTIAPELTTADVITTADVAACTNSNDVIIRPRRPAVTARRRRPWAKTAALVAAVAVMWLIVLAIMTVV